MSLSLHQKFKRLNMSIFSLKKPRVPNTLKYKYNLEMLSQKILQRKEVYLVVLTPGMMSSLLMEPWIASQFGLNTLYALFSSALLMQRWLLKLDTSNLFISIRWNKSKLLEQLQKLGHPNTTRNNTKLFLKWWL